MRRPNLARRAITRTLGLVAALTVTGVSMLTSAGAAEAYSPQWVCRGNGYALIVNYQWAYFLWNQGWNCTRIYPV